MNKTARNLDFYMKLPYAILLRQDEERDWIARVEELSGCVAHGASTAEALKNVEEVRRLWIEDALEAGDAIPEPQVETNLPSGKWLQRVPRSLHQRLAAMAAREGVSLNQFVTSVLAEAVGRRTTAISSAQDLNSVFVDQIQASQARATEYRNLAFGNKTMGTTVFRMPFSSSSKGLTVGTVAVYPCETTLSKAEDKPIPTAGARLATQTH